MGLKQEEELVQKVEEGQQEGWAIKLRVQPHKSTPSNWVPYPKDQRPTPSNYASLPKGSITMPPARDQVFKHTSPWETFHT